MKYENYRNRPQILINYWTRPLGHLSYCRHYLVYLPLPLLMIHQTNGQLSDVIRVVPNFKHLTPILNNRYSNFMPRKNSC
jgi:hypothetical protein